MTANFEGAQYSSIAYADIDGDGDRDVLITEDSNTPLPGDISLIFIVTTLGVYAIFITLGSYTYTSKCNEFPYIIGDLKIL